MRLPFTVHPVNRSLCFLARHSLDSLEYLAYHSAALSCGERASATAESLQTNHSDSLSTSGPTAVRPPQLPSDASRTALARPPFANLSGILSASLLTFEQFYLTVTTSTCATLCRIKSVLYPSIAPPR
jgi:hypothetical protein